MNNELIPLYYHTNERKNEVSMPMFVVQDFVLVSRFLLRFIHQNQCLEISVRQAIDVSGFDISPDADFTANLLWNDTLVSMDIVSALKSYQKVNHFPSMNEISRKDL